MQIGGSGWSDLCGPVLCDPTSFSDTRYPKSTPSRGILFYRSPLSLPHTIWKAKLFGSFRGDDSGSHPAMYFGTRGGRDDRRRTGRENHHRRILIMTEIRQVRLR